MQDHFRQHLILKAAAQLAECLNPQRLGWLLLFLGKPRSLQDAAREAGVPRTTLGYHVQRWVQMDMLQVNSLQKTKKYCAAMESVYLSFEGLEPEALHSILLQWSQIWQEKILRAGLEARGSLPGVLFYRSEQQLHADFAADQHASIHPAGRDAPAVLLPSWVSEFHLSYEDARELQKDLLALREKYAGRSGQRHLLQVALAPMLRD
ncbi:hypothetical protein [Deinococcus cellulosilyticus]|uniref:Uncharacterized protein n=1 Tax=Deinococcus cellulosilyticus (strain DSM 18568 / NBRC 106333 / KACC 11606 / 5516J-15) TaxID=1223518 RepID=A0A511N3T8_DEIC1|nr:hypothetical protein [Deinococcus cellulosilyticus]GEM47533.1 hypothetical protein DC3_31680 [Deinococcus cellulosilyticus NBRC 106333 = KACC 11606]